MASHLVFPWCPSPATPPWGKYGQRRHAQHRMSCPFWVTPHSHCPLHPVVGPPFSGPRGGVIPALTSRLLDALVQRILED